MRLTQWISRLERYLHEGSCIPFGWGYCRPSVYRQDYCLIAPIPLNFIIGFGHWFYWRVLVQGWGVRDRLRELAGAQQDGPHPASA